MELSGIKTVLKEKATEVGIDACGVTSSFPLRNERKKLDEWLLAGMHGTMEWLEKNRDLRCDPGLLWPGTKSVIVCLLNYFPAKEQDDPDAPVYSKYAYGKDYHKVFKKKLKSLVQFLEKEIPGSKNRAFVDSGPVMERSWATRAGLGWLGKNSLLINRDRGSFFFIGVILTDIELPPDPPFEGDFCGSCTRCIQSCPTGAIVQAGVVDARKCISYQTIEYKGNLTNSLHQRVFGCDICQDVCPWNKLSVPHRTPEFLPAPGMLELRKEEWQNLNAEDYSRLFKGTPADRTGFAGLQRNIDRIMKDDRNKPQP